MSHVYLCFYCVYRDVDRDLVFTHMYDAHKTHLHLDVVKKEKVEVEEDTLHLQEPSEAEGRQHEDEDRDDDPDPAYKPPPPEVAAETAEEDYPFDEAEVDDNVFQILCNPATTNWEADFFHCDPFGQRPRGRPKKPVLPRKKKENDRRSEINKPKINYSSLHGRAKEGSVPVQAPFEVSSPGEANLPVACQLCAKRCHSGTKEIKEHDRLWHGMFYKKLSGYHCRECTGKNTTTSFRAHMVRHAKFYHTHECHLCSAHVYTRFSLNMHLKDAHGEDVSLFCNYCEYYALTADVLRDHVRTRHPFQEEEPERKFACDACAFWTGYKEEFSAHGAEMHSSVEDTVKILLRPVKSAQRVRFHCESCDFSAYGKYDIVAHVKACHQGQGQVVMPRVDVTCSECSVTVVGQNALAEHLVAEHGYKPCSRCDFLLKEAETPHDCFKRIVSDTGRTWHHCSFCTFRGEFLKAARHHYRTTHSDVKKAFPCDECSSEFRVKSELTTHKKITHAKTKEFKCDICGLEMKKKTFLDRHMLGHQKGRMYKCRLKTCTYEVSNRFMISKHFIEEHITYDPEKEYTEKLMCDQCPFKADLKWTLMRHKEKFHSAKD